MIAKEILTEVIAILEREQLQGKTHVYLSPENWEFLKGLCQSPAPESLPAKATYRRNIKGFGGAPAPDKRPQPPQISPPIDLIEKFPGKQSLLQEPSPAQSVSTTEENAGRIPESLPSSHEQPTKPPTLGLSVEIVRAAIPSEKRLPPVVTIPQNISTQNLEELSQTVSECQLCSLCRSRTQTVFGGGTIHPEVMFIGDAPSREDDGHGRPFSDKAGELLEKIVAAMKLNMDQVYLANILKCTPSSRRPPDNEEARQCLPYLIRQITLVKPKIIVLFGPAALLYLMGKDNHEQTRGQWLNFHGIPCMPTYHPAYLLRVEEAKRAVWTDMKQVMAQLQQLHG